MGIFRMAVIAGAVGVGIVLWDSGGDRALEQASEAGGQIKAASRFCEGRPELCAALAASAAETARQEAARRLITHTSTVSVPPERADKVTMPANPPLPRRRPANFE